MTAMSRMLAAATGLADLLAPTANYGATGLADLALVLEQAGSDLGAIRDCIVAELVGVALAGILRVLHADIVGALRGCRGQRAKRQKKPGCGEGLEWSDLHREMLSL